MSLYERLSKAKQPESGGGAPEQATSTRAQEATAPEVHVRPADPLEGLKRKIHQSLVQALGPKLYDLNMTADQLEFRVRQKLTDVLAEEETPISAADRQRLITDVTDDILGYGPLEPFLK